MAKRMAFQGLSYVGTAGSTASTQMLGIVGDVTYPDTVDKVEITGHTETVKNYAYGEEEFSVEFELIDDDSDATLALLLTCKAGKTPIAYRGKDFAAGKGPDMDFLVEKAERKEPKGKDQRWNFTLVPTKLAGRSCEGQVYV